MHPLVSILIPAYNSEKWIKSTVQSALAQSWNNKEIIIVDDGSKDNTYNIVKNFESKNVKVITQENSGASAARNKALALAQGDFIQWLDSDDILTLNKIELQLIEADFNPKTKILFSSSWGSFFYSLKSAKCKHNSLWQDLSPVEWLTYHLGDGSYMYPAVWLVSRRLTETAGNWNERLSYNDDGEYFCRVVSSSEKVRFINDAKSYHRVGNLSSLSRSEGSIKALESLNLSVNLCLDYLLKLENSEATRRAAINCLQKNINSIYHDDSIIIENGKKRINELGGSASSIVRTRKFRIAQNILGMQKAATLKTGLWNLEILIRKYWDKLLSAIYRDSV